MKTKIIAVGLGIFCIALPIFANTNVTIVPEVNLHSAKKYTKLSAAEMAEYKIDAKTIKSSPVVTLSGLLQQEQSAARLTNNAPDGQTAISLRGFGDNASANSLILVDGFPLTSVTSLAPYLNNLPLLDLQQIEIFQGSQGSLWGDQAVGGVIQITTRQPKQFSISSRLATGSFHTGYINTLLMGRSNNVHYKVSALGNQTHHYRNHHKQQNADVFLQSGIDYDSGALIIRLEQGRHSLEFPGGLTEDQYRHHPRSAIQLNNHASFLTNTLKMTHQHSWANHYLLESRLYYTHTRGNGFIFLNYDRGESILNFHPRLTINFDTQKLIAGYLIQQSRFNLDNLRAHQQVGALQQNMYAQLNLNIQKKYKAILGARYATQKNNVTHAYTKNYSDDVFVTEQGLEFHPNGNLNLYLRHDGNFRFPKANELAWPTYQNRGVQVQTGSSFEGGAYGLYHSHRMLISLYRLILNHEIAFNPNPTETQPFGAYQNFSHTLRNGISIADVWTPISNLKAIMQINAVNARFASGEFKGKKIPAVPVWNGLGSLRYSFLSNWNIRYTLIYNGSQYASEDNLNVSKPLSAYWLHTAAIQFRKSAWNVSLEINNILNKNYSAYTLYNPLLNDNTYYPGTGRNLLLSAELNL